MFYKFASSVCAAPSILNSAVQDVVQVMPSCPAEAFVKLESFSKYSASLIFAQFNASIASANIAATAVALSLSLSLSLENGRFWRF